MNDNELDILLKNALHSDFVPDRGLDLQITQNAEKRERLGAKRIRPILVFIMVFCALLFCSVVAFAAWKLLAPKDIALGYGDKQLAKAFESEDAILMDESQAYGDYTVTLLGTVSGKNITDFAAEGDNVNPDKTYATVAIARTDGTPIPGPSSAEYGKPPFFVSPLVQGLNPQKYNIVTMQGGYSEIVKDGILYRIIECDNVEIFADRRIYLCVTNSLFYDRDAYNYNKDTGEISVNNGYKGMNLLFDLPLNKDKANNDAAERYLKGLDKVCQDGSDAADKAVPQEVTGENKTISQGENDSEDAEPCGLVKEILDNWTFVSEQRSTPDEEGKVYFSFKKKNGGSSATIISVNELFAENETGYSKDVWRTSDGDEHTYAFLTYRDENGEIIQYVYEIMKNIDDSYEVTSEAPEPESKMFSNLSNCEIIDLKTYYNERFDFCVDYPSTWESLSDNVARSDTGDGDPQSGILIYIENDKSNWICVYGQNGHIGIPPQGLESEEFSTDQGVRGDIMYRRSEGNVTIYLVLSDGVYGASINTSEKAFEKNKQYILGILKSIRLDLK